MANTKIYVVTSGCYSDYHICFCTLNYELAKKYVDARNPYLNSWDEFQIHEYEDNIANCELTPTFCWDEHLDAVNIGLGEEDHIELSKYCASDGEFDCCSMPKCDGCPRYKDFYIVYVKAPDADLARRIAQERLAMYKAQQAGIS